MGAVRSSFPRFRRGTVEGKLELTPDDEAIMRTVYRHRFVQADSLYRLFGHRSPDRLSRRLTLLFRHGYLDRPPAQIDKYHQGGSRPLAYGLGATGACHLKQVCGTPIGATDWRARNRTYTRDNLDHTLAVSRYLIELELACRSSGTVSFISFEEIMGTAPKGNVASSTAGSWPVPVQWDGVRSTVWVAPDAIFGLRSRGEDGKNRVAYFFLELDRGTMTIVPSERVRQSEAFPYRATILRKLYAYADSHRLRLHTEHFGIQAPRVLLLTSSSARAKAIRAASEEYVVRPQRLPSGLFLIGAVDAKSPLEQHLCEADGKQARLLM